MQALQVNGWCDICRQLIYNYPEQLFADAGVMAIEHADFEGVERLALVTGELFPICDIVLLLLLFCCKHNYNLKNLKDKHTKQFCNVVKLRFATLLRQFDKLTYMRCLKNCSILIICGAS